MKTPAGRALLLTAIFSLLSVLTACDNPILHVLMQRTARAGLDNAFAQMPRLPQFETIKIVYEEFYDDRGGGPTCYYARGYFILGSSLFDQEALDLYFESVQSVGWIPRSDQYVISKVLRRGSNEKMEIHIGELGSYLTNEIDDAQLRKTYKGIIFGSVDYILPNRDQC